jgi:hypothetical protein
MSDTGLGRLDALAATVDVDIHEIIRGRGVTLERRVWFFTFQIRY